MSAGAMDQLARGLCFNEIFVLYFLIFFWIRGKIPCHGETSLRHPSRAWAPASQLLLPLPLVSAA